MKFDIISCIKPKLTCTSNIRLKYDWLNINHKDRLALVSAKTVIRGNNVICQLLHLQNIGNWLQNYQNNKNYYFTPVGH